MYETIQFVREVTLQVTINDRDENKTIEQRTFKVDEKVSVEFYCLEEGGRLRVLFDDGSCASIPADAIVQLKK